MELRMPLIEACLVVVFLICVARATPAETVKIKADADAVPMGQSVTLEATVTLDDGTPAAGCMALPYANARRWGSHETTDASGKATFILPLPDPGPVLLQVLAFPSKDSAVSEWIWAGPPKDNQTVCMATQFNVGDTVRYATLYAVSDDRAEVFLNGHRLGEANGWHKAAVFTGIESLLSKGVNTLAAAASNGTGLAGFLARLEVETANGVSICRSNGSWKGWTEAPQGWPTPKCDEGPAVTVIGRADQGVWAPAMTDWPETQRFGDLIAGSPMPDRGIKSNAISIEVSSRTFPTPEPSDRLVCVQWEPWFTPNNAYWQTAQAVPIVGFYDSFNRDVLRQHILWFMDLGIDFIMPDWSNHIWGKQHWDERPDSTNEIIHATSLLLETLAGMKTEGLSVPKVVLMPGLTNGPPTTMTAMNEQLNWVYNAWVRNPRFAGLWQDYDGKPLVVILDTAVAAPKEQTPVDESHFTVRWMSTQLQLTKHEKLGYWSWMDGSLLPVVTYRDGKAEAVTVTPAYFAEFGWTGDKARGRRGGTTYIESFKAAMDAHPRVVQLHQWNEYAGQPEGQGYGPNHDQYVDSYSVELSDDLEPVSLTAPGYRGDKGGWGFYYLNLTRALLDIYRGETEGDTIMAVGSPAAKAVVATAECDVEWSVIGKAPENYTVIVDGKILADNIKEQKCKVSLKGLAEGPHVLTVEAKGVTTRYPLSYTRMDVPLETPIPVRVSVPFTLKGKS